MSIQACQVGKYMRLSKEKSYASWGFHTVQSFIIEFQKSLDAYQIQF